ncbi:TonB-dependent siderophore receptor [Aliarcobacter lanthieri]|uniref:TonB-dependent siderophore receptor n=1 Tax=Aliarcobacter lanthieri TaxID=1355374 RepID=UPI003AAAD065
MSGTNYKNGTADSGYLVEETKGVGIWNERKLQDTPYSMNIISKDLIENVQAKDMNQIFKMNPTTQETRNTLSGLGDNEWTTMRGFTVQSPIINGIPYASYIANSSMMQDIERVEIISGATGFLYGGGRVGGAVNYITKKPTTKDLRNITIGSYGNESYYGHIDLSGQFDKNNTFGYRVNALYQDGELPDTSEKEQKTISLIFDWKPTDNFYTDIKYSYKDVLTKGDGFYWETDSDYRKSIKNNKKYSPDWLDGEIKSNKIENNIRWDINDIFTLRTNVFYEKMKSRRDFALITYENNMIIGDNDRTFLNENAFKETKNYGANLYLDASFDTGSISHTLTTGYSLSSSKAYRSSDNSAYSYPSNNMSLNEFKNLPKPDGSLWDNTVGTQPLKSFSTQQYKNILIGDDIVFNDNWSALVGVNYATIIDTSYSNGVQSSKYDVSELTPTLSLIYKPFENLTTYATYIESLEAGTIVGSQYQNEGEILDPYKSKQYEIGAKYSMLDERALLTASLFRIEKANQYRDNTTTPKPTLTQDGEQIHQGIELGLTGKVTDNLTLFGGATFMDLSVEKATNPALEGKKPTQAATEMAKLFAEYQIPFINGLFINAGAYYTGKSYANSVNTDILPSYTLYDTGLRYKTKIDKYPTSFNLNVQNLTDKVYWVDSMMIGDPRTVTFSMKMEF